MANSVKKYGAIIEGKYHYDLINVDVPVEQNVLPYAPRWIEKFSERFSACKTEEALKKGLALISRRHYHPKPIDMPTPMPVHVAIKLAHDALTDDGFLIAPLRYDLSTSDTEYEYILRLRSTLPWDELYELTEKLKKKINWISADYIFKTNKNLKISILLSLPSLKRKYALGFSISNCVPLICKSPEELVEQIKGTRFSDRAIEI